jgi:uncharacterized OB-fold protein
MSDKVVLKTSPAIMTQEKDAWVVQLPRFGAEGNHFHTYGLLTPYFKGLTEGKLMATKCVNAKCPIGHGTGELWLPPRADCPDCHQPMMWEQIKNPTGYIYTFTYVERGGQGLEIECPYYQIDVKIPGVATIVKSYLLDRKPIKIGDQVKAGFRTGKDATHTNLDLYWELIS